MRLWLPGIILALLAGALVSFVSAAPADDEKAIREVQALWDDAWNRHDIKALGALVEEDVRFVNVAGIVLNGRGEFEKLQT